MVKALFDINVLIDHINAVPQARAELDLYGGRAISIVTWMEVMVGAACDVEQATRSFLRGFEVIDADGPIAERAVELRRSHRIRLPDAVIWATARVHALLLVTCNSRDFPSADPGVRIPYVLQ